MVGKHCPDPPFRIDTSIPMLLGVLVANRTQLNSIPRLLFPPNSHLAQGHAPLWGPAPISALVSVEGQLPCFKIGQLSWVTQVPENPMGLAETYLWLHHAQSFPLLKPAFLKNIDPFPINFLHTDLCLRVCFLGNLTDKQGGRRGCDWDLAAEGTNVLVKVKL